MRVFDAHRLVGPLRTQPPPAGTSDLEGLVTELDRLGIDACAVTATAQIFGDPADPAAVAPRWPATGQRHLTVPVVLPAVAGASWPAAVADLLAAAPPLVRACPVRHRFDPLGPVATAWWRELAGSGTPIALDVSECGLPLVASLAAAYPGLRLLLLSPGYRELRRLAELLETRPNVYIETGTIVTAGGVEWLASRCGAHRLVFGTGAPQWDDAGARFLLDHLELPESAVAMIATGSVQALIGDRWPW